MSFRTYLKQNYENLKHQSLKDGRLFEDDKFPAHDTSLFRFINLVPGSKINWKRPHEIVKNPQFIVNYIEPNDLDQGCLGNCWMIAAAASLLTVPEYIKRVIPENQSFDNYAGIFHFRFWTNGEWVDVVVDDRLPVDEKNQLLFCKNQVDTNEMFGPLLEKAYAKLNICYEFLNGGLSKDALVDFTGGVNETLNLKRSSNLVDQTRFISPDKLWDIIFKSHCMKSLMCCSAKISDGEITEDERENGIVVGHAYSLIGVYEVIGKNDNFNQLRKETDENSSLSIRLLKIRNPWGQTISYNGPWSTGSKEWIKISESIRRELGSDKQIDGQFYMSFEDFILNFDFLDNVHVDLNGILNQEDLIRGNFKWEPKKYTGTWVPGINSGGSGHDINAFWTNPQYRLNIPVRKNQEKTSVIISLLQTDSAKRRAETDGTFESSLEALGFKVFASVQDAVNNRYIYKPEMQLVNGTKVFKYEREVSKRIQLDAGDYIIVPCMYEKDKLMSYVLRIYVEIDDLRNLKNNQNSKTCNVL